MRAERFTIALALGLGLTLVSICLLGVGSARAAAAGSTITVTTTDDELDGDGDCSLREAIDNANNDAQTWAGCLAGSGDDTILLSADTYTLTLTGTGEDSNGTGDLDVTDVLTITGVGPDQTIIDASGLISDRVLHVHSGPVVLVGVTLMGGNIITDNGGGIWINNATMVLTNTVVSGNSATADWPYGLGGGVSVEGSSGMLDMLSGQIMGNSVLQPGGGVHVNQGHANLAGGQIYSNTAGWGGGVFIQSGSATLSGGEIVSNTAGGGGGVYILDGRVTMSSGEIVSNTADSGGGVYINASTAVFTQTDGSIAFNIANLDGGGVYVFEGDAMLSGGQILSNSAAYWGGGVHISQGSAILSGVQIIGNAADHGGGVYVYQDSATLSGGQILNNVARLGGGVYVVWGNTSISGGQVLSNTATWGGGVYVQAGSTSFSGGQILGNTGTWGGGIFVDTGSATLSGGQIVSNSASWTGGGVHVERGSAMLTGGQIISNAADFGGGVYIDWSSASFTQTGGTVIANSAVRRGGGVYLHDGSTNLNGGRIISNTAAWDGGGVYIEDGIATFSSAQILGNTAVFSGGAIYNSGDGGLRLINTTINGNQAVVGNGGGLLNRGRTAITFTTIASNTATSGGYGIHRADGTVVLQNTIVAYNGTTATNCSGALVSNGHNLEHGNTCNLTAASDITDTDPLLGPLTYEQGTWIHPLLEGSPAINGGNCLPVVTTVDQRGMTRVPPCDIGAYEAVLQVFLPLVLRNS